MAMVKILSRRQVVALACAGFAAPAHADDGVLSEPPYADVSGQLPDLKFSMTLASSGAGVTEADFRGHPVILYFGFTRCTDTCPLTMENATKLVRKMGHAGQALRILFVTIDPLYDTLPRLKAYMENFGPPPVIDGLRGTNEQLHAMAKRFGVEYTAVTSADTPDPVANISHSVAVYGFGPQGQAKFLLGTLAQDKADIATVAALMTKLTKA